MDKVTMLFIWALEQGLVKHRKQAGNIYALLGLSDEIALDAQKRIFREYRQWRRGSKESEKACAMHVLAGHPAPAELPELVEILVEAMTE